MSLIKFIEKYRILLSVTALAALVFILGGISIGGFITHSNQTEFCIGCHEMTIVHEEFKQTAHYRNASGVRPSCADCHVPHRWGATLLRKIQAAKDVYHHLLGTIDTREKFEERRLHMAETVWARMEANDSLSCRNCHQFDAMDLSKQKRRAQKQHENAQRDGDTCIDCHKGIAHKAVHQSKDDETNDDEEISLDF